MIWNERKIIVNMVLKAAILGKKGRFKRMVLVHGESYELLMVMILTAKTVI